MGSRAHPNRLGILGWIGGGRWGFERYMYALHRVTGLGLLAYFLMHIFVTSARVLGPGAWQHAMALVSGPVFEFGEYLVFAAFAFHAANGIRLVLIELGFVVGRPIDPVYPYATSVGRQRPLAGAVMIIAAVVALWGGADFFHLP
ncbi:MAG: succinate dehydrogenase [Candidatus Limnocylindrales bacterium]|jgi:succinate dehydrogenase / fumarate reductase cytochrome b subunit